MDDLEPPRRVHDVVGTTVAGMGAVFTDVRGQRGVVTERPDLAYTGASYSPVEEGVADREAERTASSAADAEGLRRVSP